MYLVLQALAVAVVALENPSGGIPRAARNSAACSGATLLGEWTLFIRPCRRLTLRSATGFSQREKLHLADFAT
jgi:hypothetical protein